MVAHSRPKRRKEVVVIGNGMVGHRFCQRLVACDSAGSYAITAFCEEPRPAYDRVHLSEYFRHRDAARLALAGLEWYRDSGVALHVGDRATAIDRRKRVVRSRRGRETPYDIVVLATGSLPLVPPIPGIEKTGVFVYRTLEDLEAILAYAQGIQTAVIIGGGLLGLEAAKATADLGIATHVVEAGPRLMPRQLDDAGSRLLIAAIEELGIRVHTAATVTAVRGDGAVEGVRLADGSAVGAGMIIVAAGIRPRDELARDCGLQIGPRGGVVVDDLLRSSDPAVFAIGEVALHRKTIHGLVAPGYEMADIVANHLTGTTRHFCRSRTPTRLKLLGVDVASFGNCDVGPQSARSVVYEDPFEGVYQKLVVSRDGTRLLGGVFVGDTAGLARVLGLFQRNDPLSVPPGNLLLADRGASAAGSTAEMPDDALVCSCNRVTKVELCRAIQTKGLFDIFAVKTATDAGTCCGGCLPLVQQLLADQLEAAGREVDRSLCEHFAFTRQELFEIIRSKRIKTFDELLAGYGEGRGCEICKPAVGSILASLWNEDVLDHAALQDTNDRFLANLQRGGLYSVVPRIPGGEIDPGQLSALSRIAKKHGLYTKLTSGQRIAMFGAPAHKLPDIWEELVAAGFESGHAYGRAMRTVTSCIGNRWCRFATGDSVRMAVRLERRYRGIRAPHKIKAAVSGCVRECAQAQSKDFGLIATDKGWNLFVGGNGGTRPRHAQLLASDLDEETCIRYLDRFLMYYVRSADHLSRTSDWLEKMEGGLDHLRDVIVNDRLHIAHELEQQARFLAQSYRCEWREVVQNPAKRRLFRQFVNTGETQSRTAFGAPGRQKQPVGRGCSAGHPSPCPGPQNRRRQTVPPKRALRWVAVGKVDDFPKDGAACVQCEGVQVAVYNLAGRNEWYASENTCPHQRELVLSRGLLGDQNGTPKVACPTHKRTFSLKSGHCLSGEKLAIAVFAVKVEGDEVYVQLPAANTLRKTGADWPPPGALYA